MCSQNQQILFLLFLFLFLLLIFFPWFNSILVLTPRSPPKRTRLKEKKKSRWKFFFGGGFYSYSNMGMVHIVEFCFFLFIKGSLFSIGSFCWTSVEDTSTGRRKVIFSAATLKKKYAYLQFYFVLFLLLFWNKVKIFFA